MIVGVAVALWLDLAAVGPAIAALIGALLIQIGTNFANDYYDFIRGGDTDERIGPVRVTHAGILEPEQVRRGMVAVLGLAVAVGVYLVWVGGWPVLAIGVASVACAVLYTGGPFPLAYHGLGDVFVFVFFGLVAVGGTYYVQGLSWPPDAWLAGVGLGALSTAILVVNNLRDIHTDAVAGKRTLAVRFGPAFARWEYAGALAAASLLPLVFLATGEAGVAMVLTTLVMAAAVPSLRTVFTSRDAAALNRSLGATGGLLMLHAVLFSVGWLL